MFSLKPKKAEKEEKMKKNKWNGYKRVTNMVLIYLIITLNVHGANAPIKIQRMPEWIKKKKTTLSCLQ